MELSPTRPSPRLDVRSFVVCEGAEGITPRDPWTLLYGPDRRSPRPDCGQLRREPAITELDWPFTSSPKSSEQFAY